MIAFIMFSVAECICRAAKGQIGKFSNPDGRYIDLRTGLTLEPSNQNWETGITEYTCSDGSRFADDGAVLSPLQDGETI